VLTWTITASFSGLKMTILADGKKELQGFILKQLQKSVLYRTHFKNWNFGCAKASGFDGGSFRVGPNPIFQVRSV